MHGSDWECDFCRKEFHYTAFGNWCYLLGDAYCSARTRPIWCNTCASLTSGEYIPSVEECREALERTRHSIDCDDDSQRQRFIEFASNQLKWRISRRSDPKCLGCGSHDIRFLPIGNENEPQSFSHPGCGGTIQKTSWFLGSGPPIILTVDGVRLADSTIATNHPMNPSGGSGGS